MSGKVKTLYVVECKDTGSIVTKTYTSKKNARRGLRTMRGDFDGRGPLKGHQAECFAVVAFRREESR